MAKFFRRIAALVLALVMVCLVSVPVFAADSLSADASYDGDTMGAYAYAKIERYKTYGDITYYDTDACSTDMSVSCEYRYYPKPVGAALQSDVISKSQDTGYLYVTKEFSSASIVAMADATYTFYAYIPASYGAQDFRVGPTRIEF